MNAAEHKDVTLVVRECGERTAEACVALLAEIFPGQPIARVTGDSFVATLKKSLQCGLEEARRWTLCIDADVLVLPAVKNFISEAKCLPEHFVEAQALVADKLLPACRPAGNHLYRTTHIARALACIPDNASLRPESSMIEAMANIGYPYHQSAWLVGLHDFEQAHSDLYNKAALHGHKHAYLADFLLPLWQQWANHDLDYRIALEAFIRAQENDAPSKVSRSWMPDGLVGNFPQQPDLAPMSGTQVADLLAHAPHQRPEAAELRHRIGLDVSNLMVWQQRQYALSLPLWLRWMKRIHGRYPYLKFPP